LWVLRARPDGSTAAPPTSQDALLVDTTRYVRPTAREPNPDWDRLSTFALTALAALDDPDRKLPDGAVRTPLLDLLDDEVDVTPGRYTASTPESTGLDITAQWDEFRSLLTDLADHAGRLSVLRVAAQPAPTPSSSQATTTVGDLIKAGAVTLRAGQLPPKTPAPMGAAVPLLTVAGLLHDGSPGPLSSTDPAHTRAEEGDIVVSGVLRAFAAWVHEGPPVALGPQLHVLRADPQKLDAHFLAGCLRASANGRQASTHASSSSRVDIRRLQVLRLPLDQQLAYAEVFRRLSAFASLLTKADGMGKGLVSDVNDRLAAGVLGT
jgi:hypothetical protein